MVITNLSRRPGWLRLALVRYDAKLNAANCRKITRSAHAKRFYTVAFGWQFNDYGPDYAGIQGVDREAGGLLQTDEPRTTGPLVILYSDDLEASVEAVKRAGGKILKDPYAFPGGRRFHFADPSGNELAVWSGE